MTERYAKSSSGPARSKKSSANLAAALQGNVIAAHGRHYLVELDNQVNDQPENRPNADTDAVQRLLCVTRGKKNDVATGDEVLLTRTSGDQGVIEEIVARRTLLYRSDQYRSKLLAANLTQILIVIATEPGFSDDLVSRSLVAAEAAGITARLILNKVDLTPNLAVARQRADRYGRIGYPVTEVSARTDPDKTRAILEPLLSGQSTILIGQSGMGKSSLINLMIPGLDIAVREISAALDTGKHTTTYTKRYSLDMEGGGNVVDSPGFQEFGLYHLSEGMLERAFPEFLPHLGHCKFTNCHHAQEPDCAITGAVRDGSIHPERHALFLQLCHESSQTLY